MHSWGQVDLCWLIRTEIGAGRGPRHSDYGGLDIVMLAPGNATERAGTAMFDSWVTDWLVERFQIWRQEWVDREEQKACRKGAGDDMGSGGPDPSSKTKRNQAMGGGAGAGGDAGEDG